MAKNQRGTTTQRGLGWEHIKERRRLLPLAYDTPCPICGRIMLAWQRLELDHIIPRCFGGKSGPGNSRIVHAYCNRAQGPRIQKLLQEQVRIHWRRDFYREPQSRDW